MNKFILLFICLASFLIYCTPEKDTSQINPPNHEGHQDDEAFEWEENRNKILSCQDLVLLYSGGAHRSTQWDEKFIKPYISYTDASGEEKWLFDSFLFLEIHNGNGKAFATGYTNTPANQKEWKELIDHYFQSRYCLGAINRSVEKVIERIGPPSQKRKIIIGIPEPIKGQKDWGSIRDGIPLDFSNPEDRVAAVKWYIDYTRQQFKEMEYENVDLAGFYWIAEEATNTRGILADIATYLNNLNYSFNWIPYFKSDGYSEWKKLCFNYAFLQPNYFFNDKIPFSRLDEACKLAKQFDMGLEIEFDERVLTGWGYRLEDYLKAFESNGVKQTMNIAYYQGDRAIYDLSVSKEPNDLKLYNHLCDFVTDNKF